MSELSKREQELVALGAAIASNCLPCIEFHVPAAKKIGLSDTQIQEAVQLADKLRQVPARAVLQTALARLDETASECAEPTADGCGCSDSSPGADSSCGS
jgi:AhpD family alkylhydroperoxidase